MATQSIPRLSQIFEEPKGNSTPSVEQKPASPVSRTSSTSLKYTTATLHLVRLEGSDRRSVYNDVPVFDVWDAARILGVSQDLLEKWRQRGQGPAYYQYEGPRGPVRHLAHELRAYQEAHLVRPLCQPQARRGDQ